MPQVPYSPVPQIAQQQIGQPSVHVDTPVAAFGGATAEALGSLGQTMQASGNELFTRAVALKQLDNETEARNADAQYMIQAGEIHAQYNALQGQDRVQGYKKYVTDLENLRTKIRDGLSNPMAQRMYDSSSLSTMGRSIFNGAGAAAAAQKEYVIGTGVAQMNLDAKTAEDSPDDEGLFQDKLDRTVANARNIAAAKGLPEGSAQEKLLELQSTSKLYLQRVIGKARVAPFDAVAMLEKYKGDMTTDDYLRADQVVRSNGRAVGSANIANEVYNTMGRATPDRPAATLADMEAETRSRALKFDPNDPILADHAVQVLRAKYNQDKYAQRQEQYTNQETIAGAIQTGQYKTVQEMRTDPKLAATIDALPPDKQNAIPGQINRYIAAANRVDSELSYTQLRGMSNNDVGEFLNVDPTDEKYKLSQSQIRSINDLQARLRKNVNGDPRVLKAVSLIRGAMGSQLEALGIFRRTEANKEDYDHYTGALQAALDDYLQTNKKPADDRTILEKIAPDVLKQRTEPGFFSLFGYGQKNRTPFYTQTVPEDFIADAKKDAAQHNEAEPTEQQIYQSYLRYQWQKLHKKAE